MKKVLVLLVVVLSGFGVFSQTTEAEEDLKKKNNDTIYGWKHGGMVNLTFTQVSFTNWAAGGQNSIAGNGFVNLFLDHITEKTSWENNLDLGYGLLKQGKESDGAKWMKTEDKIDFTSKYGQEAAKNLYYAGLLNFKSQFSQGYNYPNDSVAISNLLAPGYVLAALGVDYKPIKGLSVFFAPVTSKMTIVSDTSFSVAYGLETGEKFRAELGGYLKVMYKKEVKEKYSFSTRLELFANYLEGDVGYPKKIDVLWENVLGIKISKYITANLTTTLLWDQDTKQEWTDRNDVVHNGATTQFKEVFGIGFSYKF
jgi:hypothetical protein